MAEQKRLYKSRTDKMVSGVCAGIAEYFNIDPALIRLAFVLATLLDGAGLLIYIILAIVMPEAPLEHTGDEAPVV
ncbi:MAG: PspC domain-containing protein [Anaerolineae bacterium]